MSKLISLSFNYFTKTNPLIRFTDNIDKVIPKIVQPKVRIVDGKVVVDKSSLLQQMEEQTTEISEEVVEDFEDMPEEINSLSFRTRKHGKRSKNWSDEETDRFYEAITIVGTNFVNLINQFYLNYIRCRNGLVISNGCIAIIDFVRNPFCGSENFLYYA